MRFNPGDKVLYNNVPFTIRVIHKDDFYTIQSGRGHIKVDGFKLKLEKSSGMKPKFEIGEFFQMGYNTYQVFSCFIMNSKVTYGANMLIDRKVSDRMAVIPESFIDRPA